MDKPNEVKLQQEGYSLEEVEQLKSITGNSIRLSVARRK